MTRKNILSTVATLVFIVVFCAIKLVAHLELLSIIIIAAATAIIFTFALSRYLKKC